MAEIIDFVALKSKSPDDIAGMISRNEIRPTTDEEREKLLKFATADEAGREAMLSGTEPATPAMEEPEPAAAEPAPIGDAHEDATPEPAMSGSTQAELDEFMGFGSLEELKENFKRTKDLYEAAEKKHRATNGNLGNELKRAKDQLAALQAGQQSAAQSGQTQASADTLDDVPELPTLPIPPDPDDYSDGAFDDKYKAAMKEYKSGMVKYNIQLTEYNKKMKSIDSLVRKRIEPDLNEFRSMRTQIEADKKETVATQAWSSLWEDVGNIQSQYGLKTSVPVSTINDYMTVVTNPGKYSPDEVEAANGYINALPQSDRDAFDKLSGAINQYYAFDTGLPQKRYKTFQGFLYEAGMVDQWQAPAVQQAAAPRPALPPKPQQEFADAMPAAAVGSSDQAMRSYTTQGEKERRYTELTKQARANPAKFKNSGLMDELRALENDLGL